MRIAHVLWSGEIGGMQRAVYQLVRGQLGIGRDVDLVFARGEGRYFEMSRELGRRVHSLDMRGGADMRGVVRSAGLLRRYDVHHFHAIEPALFLASALAPGARRLYTERGGSQRLDARKRARYALALPLLRRYFHAYSGNTAHAARLLANTLRVPEADVLITPNGLDFDLLRPHRTRADVRAEIGASPDDFLIGTSGYLKDWKRVDLLLEGCAELRGLPWRVVVIGDGPHRAALERRAADLGIRERVSFVGLQAEVASYVAALDAFALLSTALESFGNAVVEAMALGVPSIVHAESPGIVEHIVDGRTGFVVANAQELRSVLDSLARLPRLRAEVGERGRAHVRSAYTVERMVAAYEALYARAGREGEGTSP